MTAINLDYMNGMSLSDAATLLEMVHRKSAFLQTDYAEYRAACLLALCKPAVVERRPQTDHERKKFLGCLACMRDKLMNECVV
jgi:hypothetical protein